MLQFLKWHESLSIKQQKTREARRWERRQWKQRRQDLLVMEGGEDSPRVTPETPEKREEGNVVVQAETNTERPGTSKKKSSPRDKTDIETQNRRRYCFLSSSEEEDEGEETQRRKRIAAKGKGKVVRVCDGNNGSFTTCSLPQR